MKYSHALGSLNSSLTCVGCYNHCGNITEYGISTHTCGVRRVLIWPDTNKYLMSGLENYVISMCGEDIFYDTVFVDFSLPHIRPLLKYNWVEFFKGNDIKIIIVTDRYLSPLANYLVKNTQNIYQVIYATENLEVISDKIRKRFYKYNVCIKGDALSATEFFVAKKSLFGMDAIDISISLGVNINGIYNARRRFESKSGLKIKYFVSFGGGNINR